MTGAFAPALSTVWMPPPEAWEPHLSKMVEGTHTGTEHGAGVQRPPWTC